ENINKVAFVGTTKSAIQNVATALLNKPAGLHTNDVMLASFAVQGGTATTVTAPDATWNALARVDNGTTISIITFWHAVTNAATEPASYTFTLNGNGKGGAALVGYGGDGHTARIDRDVGPTPPSGTAQ